MKKTTPLQLYRETLRSMGDSEIRTAVAAGAGSAAYSCHGVSCDPDPPPVVLPAPP